MDRESHLKQRPATSSTEDTTTATTVLDAPKNALASEDATVEKQQAPTASTDDVQSKAVANGSAASSVSAAAEKPLTTGTLPKNRYTTSRTRDLLKKYAL